jgi:Protein of unknown function (DUF2785)
LLLTSPDPHERDEVAYTELAERVGPGTEDGRLIMIGRRGVSLLGHAEIHARTFGALMVAEAVGRDHATGELDAGSVHGWQDSLCRWYLAEDDLRGWDPTLGWVHAVAHGADALGAFGRSRHTTPERLGGLLAVARDRLTASGDVLLAHAEDERVAFATALVLTRPELSEVHATAWLDPVQAAFAAGEPGPLPAWVTNTTHALRSLYLFVDRGVRAPDGTDAVLTVPHRRALLDALAHTLRLTFPYLG